MFKFSKRVRDKKIYQHLGCQETTFDIYIYYALEKFRFCSNLESSVGLDPKFHASQAKLSPLSKRDSFEVSYIWTFFTFVTENTTFVQRNHTESEKAPR